MMREAFAGKEYGFFFHFLSPYAGPGKSEEWNEYVNRFNVKKLAAQLHELHAGYAFITVGQNSGYYCTPNSVYDREVGPGWCSKRDIVAEFADELAVYGIDCYVYSQSLAAYGCEEALKKLQAVPPWDSSMHCRPYSEVQKYACSDVRLKHFQSVWNAIHTEWSKRWGTRVKGWWIDGSYYPHKLYDFPDEPNGHTFCRALRAGNPDAAVAFNSGVMYPQRNYPGSDEDYTAGESCDANIFVHNAKYLDNTRYHILTFAGKRTFGWRSKPIKSAEILASYTRTVVDNGGVVSWDLPFGLDGVDEDVMVILRDFVKRYEESKTLFPVCNLSVIPPLKDKNGSVAILSKEEMTIHVSWNGKTTPVRTPGSMTLPFAGCGEKTIEFERNGFKRYLTFYGEPYSFTLPFEYKTPHGLTKLSREGDFIRFHLDIEENTPIQPQNFFWTGSCTEIFFVLEDGSIHQYVADCNGELFEWYDVAKHPIQGIKYTKNADGYSADFLLPCPEGKSFKLEMTQRVGIDNVLCSTMYFSGSETGFRRIQYYATVNL